MKLEFFSKDFRKVMKYQISLKKTVRGSRGVPQNPWLHSLKLPFR